MLLYVDQLAWGSANKHRKLKEVPPLCEASQWVVTRLSKLGFNDFSWAELESFENKTGIVFNTFESDLLKKCCSIVSAGHIEYKENGAEPPYMSDEFRARREKALEQAQQFNDERGETKR